MPKKTLPALPTDAQQAATVKKTAFQRSAQRHATEALRVLRAIMHDTKADPAARISAAAKVIEFGHGRASSGEPVIVTQVNVRLDAQDQSL